MFDLDGCLINTIPLIVASYRHTLSTCLPHLSVPDAEVLAWVGDPLLVTLGRLSGGDAALTDTLVATYRAFNLAHHDAMTQRVDGMAAAVGRLAAAGVKLAVVTSKLTHLAHRGLEVCGLRPHFPVVVGVERCAHHKPHPAPALAALAELGEAPGPHVAFVGDAPTDVLCGHAAGCGASIAVAWTVFGRGAFEGAARPTHWARDAAALGDLLLGASVPE